MKTVRDEICRRCTNFAISNSTSKVYSENVWEFILICDRTLTNLEVDSMKLLTPPPNALWIFMESLPQCTISLAKFWIQITFYKMLLRMRIWPEKNGDPSISRLKMWSQNETYSSNNHLTLKVECTSFFILQTSSQIKFWAVNYTLARDQTNDITNDDHLKRHDWHYNLSFKPG